MALLIRGSLRTAARQYGSVFGNNIRYSSTLSLKDTVREIIPEKRELFKKLRTEHGKQSLGEVTIETSMGGMRGLKAMLWEGSVLDPDEGIRFHGMTIADCQAQLPKGKTGIEMLPEAMFWLLLTGKVPTVEQVRGLSKELAERVLNAPTKPDLRGVENVTVHPMVRLSTGLLALSGQSEFQKAYFKGINKADYWETMYEDAMNLLAWVPTIAAYALVQPSSIDALWQRCDDMTAHDWCKNFAFMLDPQKAAKDEDFIDLIRLYVALHADHEGGNVSAHATHLVGSALSDAFLSYSSGINGLAGPLHGLAAQDVLRFVLDMQKEIGMNPSDDTIRNFLWKTLKSGQVIPGYGHGVLRKPDPRFRALNEFGVKRPNIAQDKTFQLVNKISQIAPGVLIEHGKTKNPQFASISDEADSSPNVDAQSGVLFYNLGLQDFTYYTVIFGVSRAIGCMAQLIWDRALGLPIERPKSVSMEVLKKLVEK